MSPDRPSAPSPDPSPFPAGFSAAHGCWLAWVALSPLIGGLRGAFRNTGQKTALRLIYVVGGGACAGSPQHTIHDVERRLPVGDRNGVWHKSGNLVPASVDDERLAGAARGVCKQPAGVAFANKHYP